MLQRRLGLLADERRFFFLYHEGIETLMRL